MGPEWDQNGSRMVGRDRRGLAMKLRGTGDARERLGRDIHIEYKNNRYLNTNN